METERAERPETSTDRDLETVESIVVAKEKMLREIRKRIFGQEELVEHLLIALFARGHSLLVGVPGLAKTSLIATLADVLSLDFNRIQFTPDLMPSDITGTDILEEDVQSKKRTFSFIKGPVFTNLLLADEINRTPPKTQAALLQSMQEYQVSAGGKTHMLPLPFLVFATQNPIEQEGTYPLPEAQLDRFMFHLQVDYPSPEDEIQIATYSPHLNPVVVEPVLDAAAILRFQELVGRVPVSEEAVAYAVSLVRRSRPQDSSSPSYIKEFLHWGAGPRASQFLVLAGQSRALLDGRFVVGIEDIRSVAVPTMRHRLVTNFHADARGVLRDDIVRRLLDEM